MNHPSNSFLECIRDCFLYQHVTEPTHYRGNQRPSVLDLILTNKENMIQDLVYNDPIGKSHHVTLNWQLSCYSDVERCSAMKRCYQKGNYGDMRRILGEVNWSNCLINGTVDEMWGRISEHLENAVEMCVPLKRIVNKEDLLLRRRPVWMNDELLGHTREKKKLFEKYKVTKEEIHRQEYVEKRNVVKRELRKAIKEYEMDIARKAKRDPKGFYKFVNSKMKTKSRVADLLYENEVKTSTEKDKSEVLNKFFSSVFTEEDVTNVPDLVNLPVIQPLDNIVFSEEDIRVLLVNIDSNKSPGPDRIHPRVLKECAEVLKMPLFLLFRKSLDSGEIPQAWKNGYVTPVYKKGSRTLASNYRPISLTSVRYVNYWKRLLGKQSCRI